MFQAKGAGFLISCQGARKIVQADQTNCHIAEDDRDSLDIFVRQQALVRAFVVSDGFFKSILPVIDVAHVDFQPREAPLVIEASEYPSGAFRGVECLIVFAEQNQRLNRAA